MISVVVPVYNVRDYLADCVNSILAQTCDDWECLLVDDGSTDGSAELCDKLQNRDNRIKVLHKSNGGLSDARNAGISVAKGDYIAFVDSDDAIYPSAFEDLRGRMETDDLDVAIGDVIVNDLKTDEQRLFGPLKGFCDQGHVCTWQQLDNLLSAMFNVTMCNKLFKREIFDNRRFIKGIKFEDVPMWTDILFSGVRIGCVNKPVYRYNVNRDGSIVTVRDYRGYPDAWTCQRKALASHGLFNGILANNFVARIVMKFIQAYNLSSRMTRREFYQRAQMFFRDCRSVGLDNAHTMPIAVAEFVHFGACRNLPYHVYNFLFLPERIIASPKINVILKKLFQ